MRVKHPLILADDFQIVPRSFAGTLTFQRLVVNRPDLVVEIVALDEHVVESEFRQIVFHVFAVVDEQDFIAGHPVENDEPHRSGKVVTDFERQHDQIGSDDFDFAGNQLPGGAVIAVVFQRFFACENRDIPIPDILIRSVVIAVSVRHKTAFQICGFYLIFNVFPQYLLDGNTTLNHDRLRVTFSVKKR